jgi:hypothetical protein
VIVIQFERIQPTAPLTGAAAQGSFAPELTLNAFASVRPLLRGALMAQP